MSVTHANTSESVGKLSIEIVGVDWNCTALTSDFVKAWR